MEMQATFAAIHTENRIKKMVEKRKGMNPIFYNGSDFIFNTINSKTNIIKSKPLHGCKNPAFDIQKGDGLAYINPDIHIFSKTLFSVTNLVGFRKQVEIMISSASLHNAQIAHAN